MGPTNKENDGGEGFNRTAQHRENLLVTKKVKERRKRRRTQKLKKGKNVLEDSIAELVQQQQLQKSTMEKSQPWPELNTKSELMKCDVMNAQIHLVIL